MGLIDAELITVKASVTLRDISLDGFGLESTRPVELGTRHAIRFTTPAGDSVVMKAEVVSSKPLSSRDARPQFLLGFRFIGLDVESRSAIEWLLDTVTSPLIFL
jgi:hypothetical protein